MADSKNPNSNNQNKNQGNTNQKPKTNNQGANTASKVPDSSVPSKKPESIDSLVESLTGTFKHTQELWEGKYLKNMYGPQGAISYTVDKYADKTLASKDIDDIFGKFQMYLRKTVAEAYGLNYSNLGEFKSIVNDLSARIFNNIDKNFFEKLLLGNKFDQNAINQVTQEITKSLNTHVVIKFRPEVVEKISWSDKTQRESWAEYLVESKKGEQRDMLYNQLVSNPDAFYNAVINKVITKYSQEKQQ